jgi:hypothetical protein
MPFVYLFMHLLFISPRFHTNQIPIISTIVNNNHKVSFLVLYQGKSEDHSILTPQFLKLSLVSRLVNKVLNREGDIDFIRDYGIPSVGSLYKQINQINPDIVIIRGSNWLTFTVVLIAKLQSRKLIFYNQHPLYRKWSRQRLIKYQILKTIHNGPIIEITPVLGDVSQPKSRNPHCYYLPFVVYPSGLKEANKKSNNNNNNISIMSIGKFVPRKKPLIITESDK